MILRKKIGFTLIELLVVMSIIGLLAAALTTQVTKIRQTAGATKCKANLRNLAQAAMSFAVQSSYMPCAGSQEYNYPDEDTMKTKYAQRTAWVQWTGKGQWVSDTEQVGLMTPSSFYGDSALCSVTNGILWGYVGRDLSVYICDIHAKAAALKKLSNVRRSYVMNAYFGYDYKTGLSEDVDGHYVWLNDMNGDGKAGIRLLFSELPARNISASPSVTDKDGVLETKISGYTDGCTVEEKLGFNHFVGKRYVSHVVFADGHVDALIEPKSATDRQLKDLVQQLCNGREIEQDLREKMR